MLDFTFDKDKSKAALLYICERLGGTWDIYSLLKILYFAECKHLINYGRPITGDTIIAMDHGPVPSISYDSVKPAKADPAYFEVIDYIVKIKQQPNLDCLSDSDIECLDQSISENKGLNFGQLKQKSHDASYDWAIQKNGKNSVIPYIEIARMAGVSNEMLNYIQLNTENQNCLFYVPPQ